MTENERLDFIKEIYPYAKQVEDETGLSLRAQLSQCIAESGWKIPEGNAMFGIKDTDGLNGNEMLVRTKEILDNPYKKFPVIHSITPFDRGGKTYYKYDVEDYFRKYDTPKESFLEHAKFFTDNPRYSKAWEVRHDPFLFATEIAKAGYATALNYEDFLYSMILTVDRRLKKLNLL